MSASARFTYTSRPCRSRARRPTVSESSIALRHAASVRQACSARDTSITWRRSIQVIAPISTTKPATIVIGKLRYQGVTRSRALSSR